MIDGVSVAWSDLPRELLRRHRLERLAHFDGERREVRFMRDVARPRIPVIREGQLQLFRWGNTRRQSRFLPRAATLPDIRLQYDRMERVTIPAGLARDGGVWFNLRQGVEGLLLPDERDMAVCYVLTEPSSHTYKNMTRSPVMPVCVGRDY